MTSLRTRLLLASSAVLVLFVVVTGFALTEASRERALLAQEQRMKGLVYALLGAAEVSPSGELILVGEERVDARLARPASDLAAAIFDETGSLLWSSTSADTVTLTPLAMGVDEWRFVAATSSADRFAIGYGVRWLVDDSAFVLRLQISEEAAAFFAAEQGFARRLWLWLALPALALLLLQLLVLGWAMRPLHHMALEVNALERGERERIEGPYPPEIDPLANAVNALIAAETVRRRRYRDALGDLSHSLKTPLAAARTLLQKPALDRTEIEEQLSRMDRIIRFHLARTTAQATATFQAALPVAPVVERMCATLAKVYAGRRLRISRDDIPTACTARIGEDDLFEVLGNLMDNACKWARAEVRISARCERGRTLVFIDDDGPGFPDQDLAHWLERGARADQYREGQGLGIAVAHDVLRSAGGELELDRSPLGGARLCVRLPGV